MFVCMCVCVVLKTSKQGALLSNLHERLLQTDQGTYVLCSNIVSPSQNTGELHLITVFLSCNLMHLPVSSH